jgi:hypothetical protein
MTLKTVKEQEAIKRAAYKEAMLYMKEAKAFMKKAPKDDGYDDFIKYKRDLRKICSTACKGMAVAVDAYLKLNNVAVNRRQRNNIYYMRDLVCKIDYGLGVKFYSAHNILYWNCCCDGMSYISFIEMGFENVMEIINKIKPTARGAL